MERRDQTGVGPDDSKKCMHEEEEEQEEEEAGAGAGAGVWWEGREIRTLVVPTSEDAFAPEVSEKIRGTDSSRE